MAGLSNRLLSSSGAVRRTAATRCGSILSSAAPSITAIACTSNVPQQQQQQRRTFAKGEGGSRGARGHGWYVKYRSGRGGRHLQGDYHDRESPAEMAAWNESVLALGSQRCYLDVVMEPRRAQTMTFSKKFVEVPPLESLSSDGKKVRLELDIASTVMPETTQNFLDLLKAPQGDGYKGTRLYRVEKKVGIYGGDMLTNTGKVGKAAKGNPMTIEIANDPLALWHIPGTITMIVPKVGEIDSRFMLIAHAAPHVDGIARAFGQLTPESTEIVQQWVDTLMTRFGIPTSYDLIVTDCGLLPSSSSSESSTSSSVVDRVA